MDIASLVTELRPMLADPRAHLGPLTALLGRASDDAEYEVLRAFAAPQLRPALEPLRKSPDPRERLRALRLSALVLGRADLDVVLRRTANDPHQGVRRASWVIAKRFALPGVSLPFEGQDRPSGRRSAAMMKEWTYWGWFFGSLWGRWRGGRHGARLKQRAVDAGVDFPATLAELSSVLELPGTAAFAPLLRAGCGPGAPYVAFSIPKASGAPRVIHAPRAPLKKAQRALLERLFARLSVHPACHGFVAGRSTVTNAAPHVGAKLVLKTDIEDFFPSIHYRRVEGLLRLHGAPAPVGALIARLVTYRHVLDDGTVAWPSALPQGAPTSPAIANLVCGRLDARLAGLSARAGARYTRYADDLTFSFQSQGPSDIGRFFWWVNAILQQEGFCENVSKRRVLRDSGRQQVTGLVVNRRLGLPREARRLFRATLTNCERHGLASQARGRRDLGAYLLGYAAYAHMVQPELGAGWLTRVRALLARGAPA